MEINRTGQLGVDINNILKQSKNDLSDILALCYMLYTPNNSNS